MDVDRTNIPGTPHIDSFKSKPQTQEFDEGYGEIDWSKKRPGKRTFVLKERKQE